MATSAEVETPMTIEKFLFLVLFLLAKGEKVRMNNSDTNRGCSNLILSACDSRVCYTIFCIYDIVSRNQPTCGFRRSYIVIPTSAVISTARIIMSAVIRVERCLIMMRA